MSAFRTTLDQLPEAFSISYTGSILSMGSCFATQMAQRLSQRKFNVLENPFGILYNPISIAYGLEILAGKRLYTQEDLFEHQSLWHSSDHHGAFSAPNPSESLVLINQSLKQARAQLATTNTLLITLGTAFIWKEKQTQKVVANCHKRPTNHFTRVRCSVDEMETALYKIINTYQQLNPNLRCLITVSPVRHLRDGMINNQLSKASLLLTAHTLTKKLPNVYYFPAYEILMDDLRDYRFYKADMLHPNEVAVDYIWSIFKAQFFESATLEKMHAVEPILKAVNHRPLYPNSKAQQAFKAALFQRIERLEKKYPDLSFTDEKLSLGF